MDVSQACNNWLQLRNNVFIWKKLISHGDLVKEGSVRWALVNLTYAHFHLNGKTTLDSSLIKPIKYPGISIALALKHLLLKQSAICDLPPHVLCLRRECTYHIGVWEWVFCIMWQLFCIKFFFWVFSTTFTLHFT